MQDYQRAFLDLALEYEVLRFGEFTLKSGRVSPYFFNSGLFDDGRAMARLGRYYAGAIADALASARLEFDMLFGPAYKGIPLVVATAIALHEQHGHNVPYAFNRKEAKRHGEGGVLVGAPVRGRVLVVDDVISAGTSVQESQTLIAAAGARLAGVVISLDRQERGSGDRSAVQEIEDRFGVPVISIANLETLIRYLEEKPELAAHLEAVRAYQQRYGSG